MSRAGVDVPVRHAAPEGALLIKPGTSRAHKEDRLEHQRAAYASLDQEDGPSDAEHRLMTPCRRLHTAAVSAATSELNTPPNAGHVFRLITPNLVRRDNVIRAEAVKCSGTAAALLGSYYSYLAMPLKTRSRRHYLSQAF